jgi:hypothetical protein
VNTTVGIAARDNFAIVVWAARTADGVTDLYAATSKDGGAAFTSPVRVNDVPGDARTNGEYAPRVAIGRQIHIVWATSLNDKIALRVARSSDEGRTFTPAVTLHEEGLANGRGWQSIGLAADGTVHAAWLDGRNDTEANIHAGHGQPGRPAMHGGKMDIFYGSLTPSQKNVSGRMISSDTCQCCKTALAVGPDGSVNVAWRQIFGDNIRDIAFVRSQSGGRDFGPQVRVSVDNWLLNGCPDDGPAMVADRKGGVHIAWPTLVAGEQERIGLFYAHSADGRAFTPRVEIATLGSLKPGHLQMAIRPDGRIGLAWDEISDGVRKIVIAEGTMDGRGPAVLSKGRLISDPAVSGTYPSIAPSKDGFLVAWTSGAAEASKIKIARVSN